MCVLRTGNALMEPELQPPPASPPILLPLRLIPCAPPLPESPEELLRWEVSLPIAGVGMRRDLRSLPVCDSMKNSAHSLLTASTGDGSHCCLLSPQESNIPAVSDYSSLTSSGLYLQIFLSAIPQKQCCKWLVPLNQQESVSS